MRGVFYKLFDNFRERDRALVGVEVGVLYGLNAFDCLIRFPNLTMHLVDSYSRHDSPQAKKASKYILAPFGERAIFHYKPSVEAAKDFADGSLDFVYIDANHDEGPFRMDVEAWLPKVKHLGVIGGHDFFGFGPLAKDNAVRKVVLEKFGACHFDHAPCDWWITVGQPIKKDELHLFNGVGKKP